MNADQIVQHAREIAGLEEFDSLSFQDGLEIAVEGINYNRERKDAGRQRLYGQFCALLARRLKVADHLRRNPHIRSVPVVRPVITIGLPRTGSTLLSNLLAQDSKRRTLLRWEVEHPVPPPQAGKLKTDPRCLEMIEAASKAPPKPFLHIHYEAPDSPTECHHILSQDFRSTVLDALISCPAYTEWLLKCDMSSAYAYHKTYLQLLQSCSPGNWNLKLPSHALHIRTLMQTYPDARIIWAHRDPYTVAASFYSVMLQIQTKAFSGPDRDFIFGSITRRFCEQVARPMAFIDASGTDPFFHIFYDDLVKDPVSQMRKLYAWLGDEWTPDVEGGIRAWLADNRQHKYGKHEYRVEDFEFAFEKARPIFDTYIRRFGVRSSHAAPT